MKIENPFFRLTTFEKLLWATSVAVVLASFFISNERDVINLIASVVGVTALIFIARGFVVGQILVIFFSILYAVVSYGQAYYGEMITYLGMSAPAAIVATVAWIKNPYEKTKEVRVGQMKKRSIAIMVILSLFVTVVFYFVLRALGTANLYVSTVSVLTSFLASYMMFIRVPYYALGYVANDIVLIVLWVVSTVSDRSYLPMVLCFVMFLFNDLYGFFSWHKMRKRQTKGP